MCFYLFYLMLPPFISFISYLLIELYFQSTCSTSRLQHQSEFSQFFFILMSSVDISMSSSFMWKVKSPPAAPRCVWRTIRSTLAMARPEEVERLGPCAPNQCHSAVQMPWWRLRHHWICYIIWHRCYQIMISMAIMALSYVNHVW